jgi:hypothetical protein
VELLLVVLDKLVLLALVTLTTSQLVVFLQTTHITLQLAEEVQLIITHLPQTVELERLVL